MSTEKAMIEGQCFSIILRGSNIKFSHQIKSQAVVNIQTLKMFIDF